jgi:hypothetical protein
MRLILLALAGSLVAAAPAMANETRVEAHTGVIWNHGTTDATAGVAAGYDFNLGPAFAGAEVSADKILNGSTNKVSVGVVGRLGAGFLGIKAYALGGYATEPCSGCAGAWQVGGGIQKSFLMKFYGKLEYRHYMSDDNFPNADAVTVGAGVKF